MNTPNHTIIRRPALAPALPTVMSGVFGDPAGSYDVMDVWCQPGGAFDRCRDVRSGIDPARSGP